MPDDKAAGIAIITYKRPDHLEACLDHVLRHSKGDFSLIVSSDEEENAAVTKICADRGVTLLSGPNRGVIWNKNRALHYFMTRTDCDPIILLEDDAKPIENDWLQDWVEATRRWDHVNFSAPGLLAAAAGRISGAGTPADPHIAPLVTGQCTSTSRRAMEIVGYLDPRFKGYGYGHAEWSIRHTKMLHPSLSRGDKDTFYSITGHILDTAADTFRNNDDVARNSSVLNAARNEAPTYKDPWNNDIERSEMEHQTGSTQRFVSSDMPPMMTVAEADTLARHFQDTRIMVEFGCGGSTLLALNSGVHWTASVESDLAWIYKLRERPDITAGEANHHLAFIHADIGPVGGLGTPQGDGSAIKWPSYYRAVWQKLDDPKIVDTVFVDGRFRVACALTAMLHCERKTKIIIHDFWNRPFYHAVLGFADVVDRKETLVVLRRKRNIDGRKFGLALQEFALDPR